MHYLIDVEVFTLSWAARLRLLQDKYHFGPLGEKVNAVVLLLELAFPPVDNGVQIGKNGYK